MPTLKLRQHPDKADCLEVHLPEPLWRTGRGMCFLAWVAYGHHERTTCIEIYALDSQPPGYWTTAGTLFGKRIWEHVITVFTEMPSPDYKDWVAYEISDDEYDWIQTMICATHLR